MNGVSAFPLRALTATRSCVTPPAAAQEAEAAHQPIPRCSAERSEETGRGNGGALGFLCPQEGASLLGMGRAVGCLSLLIISSLLAVGAEPLRHRVLKEITGSVQALRHLLPPALPSSSFILLSISNKKNQPRMTQAIGVFMFY